MFSYAPFWRTIKRKNVTTYMLIHNHGISSSTIQKLRDNESVTLTTLDDLCQILDCGFYDIVEFVKIKPEKNYSKNE